MSAAQGAAGTAPDASIVVPVNAQGDLENVVILLGDLARYAGPHAFETLLVVNNYAEDDPARARVARGPPRRSRARVPSVREPGVAVALSARVAGMRAVGSPYAIHLDADCRVPDPTSLLDWYVERLHSGDGSHTRASGTTACAAAPRSTRGSPSTTPRGGASA